MNEARHEATINGLKIVYYRFGSGEPLLFLHGGRLRALTFKHSLEELAARYTVIAPDVPGYGRSDTPKENWSYSNYAEFFSTFLEKTNLQNVTLVGYSMGGGIAFNLAAGSKRISRLVLVDASGLPGDRKTIVYRHIQRLMFYIMRPKYYGVLATLLEEAIEYSWKHKSDRAQMKGIRQACSTTPYDNVLHLISTPTLLLWGDDDKDVPLEVANKFHSLISQSQLNTVRGIHDWPLYKPLLFSQSVL